MIRSLHFLPLRKTPLLSSFSSAISLRKNESTAVVHKFDPNKEKMVLSIDPAINNCAFAILDGNKKIVWMDKVRFSSRTFQLATDKIIEHCRTLHEKFPVDTVLVESQFTGKSKLIESIFYTYFRTLLANKSPTLPAPSQVFIVPPNLIKNYYSTWGTTYWFNKKHAIEKALELDASFKELKGKKDDYADAYLQARFYIDSGIPVYITRDMLTNNTDVVSPKKTRFGRKAKRTASVKVVVAKKEKLAKKEKVVKISKKETGKVSKTKKVKDSQVAQQAEGEVTVEKKRKPRQRKETLVVLGATDTPETSQGKVKKVRAKKEKLLVGVETTS